MFKGKSFSVYMMGVGLALNCLFIMITNLSILHGWNGSYAMMRHMWDHASTWVLCVLAPIFGAAVGSYAYMCYTAGIILPYIRICVHFFFPCCDITCSDGAEVFQFFFWIWVVLVFNQEYTEYKAKVVKGGHRALQKED